MKSCRNYFKMLIHNYIHDEMSVYAAQASFFIILAAFPFFMLLLSLIKWLPLIQESDLLSSVVSIFPDNLDALAITVIHDAQKSSSAALLSASALAAIWSSSKGMLSIERGLNRAYGIEVTRNYFVRRLVCSGYTLLFTCFCAVSLVFFGFGSVFIMFFLILAFYVILPYQKQTIIHQVPGAWFTTIGWTFFSWAFSFYFRHFDQYIPTYGSLTAIILLMLWLYFGLCILLIGAEINSVTTAFLTNKNSH
ncbi:MAG: YihY/virulence factor BrkB family protein [Lachnoclostridium sp.]|nr:YihY/virulence factor BrkB family protein [Lachnoclostridium sp.]